MTITVECCICLDDFKITHNNNTSNTTINGSSSTTTTNNSNNIASSSSKGKCPTLPMYNNNVIQSTSSASCYSPQPIMTMNQLGGVVSTQGCEHYACYECLKNYFRSYVDRPGVEDYSTLDCPGQGCDKVFIADDVLPRIMPNIEDVHYWWRSVIEKTIMDSIGYCPYPDCLGSFELPLPEQLDKYKEQQQIPIAFSTPSSSRSIPEPHQHINEKDIPLFAECLECNRGICLTCHGTWHPDQPCKNGTKFTGTANWKQHDDTYYRESLANKRKQHQRALSIEARHLAQKNQWTRCPKCKEMVERTSGCLTILCRCGTSFCYRCGSRSNTHNYCNCQHLPPGRVQAMRQPMFSYN